MPSNGQGIGLPPSQLDRVFPFHLAIDKDFLIVQVGPSLLRACPNVAVGVDIRRRFTLVSPEIELDFAALSILDDQAMLWEHTKSGLRFRGQLLAVGTPPALLCLWSPWLADYADMDRHGLLPGDFAIHDSSIDLLQSLQSHKIALQDERDLAERLSEQRAGLLQANAELSRQFGLLWDELVNLEQREAEAFKIALIANNTDNAVVMTDAQGRVEWVNEAFTHITGYSLEEMLGKTPGSMLQGEKSDPKVIEYTREQIRRGESFGADIINYSKSGREYWIQFEVQPIRDENDRITNWMAIERDITEQKKSELALLEAKKAAEAANRAKSAFLATMSHEIRTPMNAVLGTLSLLQDSALDEEQAVWVNSAYSAANALLNIIEDILDFSKIEADKLTLQNENFNLKSLLDEVIQIFQIRAEAKGLTLTLDIDPNIPPILHGDPFRLRQILVNLIGNAIKFTDQGGIAASVVLQERAGAKNLLRFHVKDSGIGIPEDAQASLFNQFVQLDTGTLRRYGGTGLGLAISKRLAALMGGDIGVSSQAGKGSDFWFTAQLETVSDAAVHASGSLAADAPPPAPPPKPSTLPVRRNGGSSKMPAPQPDRRRKVAKILVAEDGEINRLVVTAMLGKAGYHVETAQDGIQALEAACCGNYDLILMDVQMPEMDGYEATAAIRNLPDHRAQVPILAFTANALQEDRNACLAAGMNDFISKPVKKDSLLSTVASWLRKNGDARPAPAVQADLRSEPDILVLDEKALQALAAQIDEQIMKDTMLIFFADTDKRVKRIAQAVEAKDYHAIGFEAHSIKSAAMTLGALRLAASCRNIENACTQGNHEAALCLSQGLGQAFEETRAAFAKHDFSALATSVMVE